MWDISKLSEEEKPYFDESHGFGPHKNMAIELLRRAIQMLNTEGIRNCLISGTLLGQVRHNDFIPWDDDLDLLVGHSLINKLSEVAEKYPDLTFFHFESFRQIKVCLKEGLPVPDTYGWGTVRKSAAGSYSWPFMDLWTFKHIAARKIRAIRGPYLAIPDKIDFFGKEWVLPKFFPFQEVEFLGMMVNVPRDPDYFLHVNYGANYMTRFESNKFCHKEEKQITDIKVVNG